MKINPTYHTYEMQSLPGLNLEVRAARKLIKASLLSYARVAQMIGVSKDMVKSVLIGRKKSARVLAGIAEVCRARLEGRQ